MCCYGLCQCFVHLARELFYLTLGLLGIDIETIKKYLKLAARTTASLAAISACLFAVFSVVFVVTSLFLLAVYARFTPYLHLHRSLNIASTDTHFEAKVLLHTEMKSYKYLCFPSNYHMFDHPVLAPESPALAPASIDSSKSSQDSSRRERAKSTSDSKSEDSSTSKSKRSKSAALSRRKDVNWEDKRALASFCRELKSEYFDSMNLDSQVYSVSATLTDQISAHAPDENKQLHVRLSVVYLDKKKTRVKSFDSLFYSGQRTFLFSRRLRRLMDWFWPVYSRKYTSGHTVLDNSSDNLLLLHISIPKSKTEDLQLTELTVDAYLEARPLVKLLLRFLPVIVVMVAATVAWGAVILTAIIGGLALYKLYPILFKELPASAPSSPDVSSARAGRNEDSEQDKKDKNEKEREEIRELARETKKVKKDNKDNKEKNDKKDADGKTKKKKRRIKIIEEIDSSDGNNDENFDNELD